LPSDPQETAIVKLLSGRNILANRKTQLAELRRRTVVVHYAALPLAGCSAIIRD